MTARHAAAESSRGSRRPELERQCTHARLHAYVSSQVRQMGAASPRSSRSTRDSGRGSGAVRMVAARSPMAWPLFSRAAPDTNVTLCHNQGRRRRPMASTREWFETVAEARRRAEAGTALGLSAFASVAVEDAVAANPKTFFQLFWIGDRESNLARMQRARDAGAKALIVTLDWSFANGRDWGSPAIPEQMDLRTLIRLAPEGILKPSYVRDWLRHGGLPDLTVPNMAAPGEPAPTFFGVYGEWMQTPPPTWDDIAWLREQWGAPFMVKGVMRPDDARRAVDIGATAISVSNHGGNNLDGTPASIRALPGVADAVGGQIEVLLDGGIRRGSDVVKALALGARAVMVGRAYLWGLAATGQAGVENVLDIP